MAIFAAFIAKFGPEAALKAFEVFEKAEARGYTREWAIVALVDSAQGLVTREQVDALSEAYDNIGVETLAEARGET